MVVGHPPRKVWLRFLLNFAKAPQGPAGDGAKDETNHSTRESNNELAPQIGNAFDSLHPPRDREEKRKKEDCEEQFTELHELRR